MNIGPLCKAAMDFLKGNIQWPKLGTVTNIGEISEIDWYEGTREEKAGCLYVTNDDSRIVGFKRV